MGFDFVALDVETANARRGSICAIGLAVVEGGAIVRSESWLCRPPPGLDEFNGMNISIHGIRPADVADQPSFAERLPRMLDVIGDRPVIAHNAAFDIGAIREACTAVSAPWPTLTYGCSLVMARRLLDLVSYRLPIVCADLGVELRSHHDAGADASAAASAVLALARRRECGDLEELARLAQVRLGVLSHAMWNGCVSVAAIDGEHPTPNPEADPLHPLFGQVMVFTGGLSFRREDAWAIVANFGATPAKSVTKKTTMLVIGDGFTGNTPEEYHTGKAAKAVKLRETGQRIEVLTEGDLIDLLSETQTSGVAA